MEDVGARLKRKFKKFLIFSIGPVLIIFVVLMLLPSILIETVVSQIDDLSIYERECPELVHTYLMDNYEEFERKVKSYCNDPNFLNFIAGMEFDNAYSKLVYGGTDTYSQKELKGNAKGVQDQNASWVSEDNGQYKAKSVLETIEEYKKKGVSDENININDEYLLGYGESAGLKDNTVPFNEWIKASYYNIPFYYHWNSAKGYGTDNNVFSWKQDPFGYWTFAMQKDFIDLFYTSEDTWNGTSSAGAPYSLLSYTDYLKMDLMKAKNTNPNKKNAPYAIMEAPFCYKQEVVDGIFEKVFRLVKGQDTYSQYTMYTMMNTKYTDSDYNGVAGISDDMYMFDWFKEKQGKKTNYETYLSNLSNNEKNTYGKRELIINSEVSKWKNSFAEYFAKEIYYEYPNRQYIMDWFMDTANREKKIAFLQRSFYAMATGSSFDADFEETYSIKDGTLVNDLTGKVVGAAQVQDYSFTNVRITNVTTKESGLFGFGTKYDTTQITKFSELQKMFNESANIVRVSYVADLNFTINGKAVTLNDIPFTYGRNGDSDTQCTLYFNKAIDGNSNVITAEKLGQIFDENMTWDSLYYKSNSNEDGSNVLDGCKSNLKSWQFDVNMKGTKETLTYEDFSKGGMEELLKKQLSDDKSLANVSGLFTGKVEGTRKLSFSYSDHSFLTYDVAEKSDANGNLSGVNIEIYTYYPDLSKYDEGEYRVAYGFETEGAITEAYKLLQYWQENGTLDGVSGAVDFEQLYVSLDEKWAKNGYVTSSSDLETFIVNMLMELESQSNWSDVHNARCGSEADITVGIMQWYHGRAHNILKRICKKDKAFAKATLGDALYVKITKETGWTSFTQDEILKVQNLLGSDVGIEVQKLQYAEDISGYIKIAQSKGLTNSSVIAYYCNLYHNRPASADEVLAQFFAERGNDVAPDSVDRLYAISMQNSAFTSMEGLIKRHTNAYEKCKTLVDVKQTFASSGTGKVSRAAVKYAMSQCGAIYSQSLRDQKGYYDCSSLVYRAYKSAGFDITGKGTTASAIKHWCDENAEMVDISSAEAGDLLFYADPAVDTYYSRDNHVTHVSMSIGDNKLVEANSSKGIVTTRDVGYYEKYVVGVYRVKTKAKSEKKK